MRLRVGEQGGKGTGTGKAVMEFRGAAVTGRFQDKGAVSKPGGPGQSGRNCRAVQQWSVATM